MPYPKYPPELKLNKKLTLEQVELIRAKRAKGFTLQELANDFGVSVYSIWWNCKPKEERQEICKAQYELYNHRTPEQRKASAAKFNKRKNSLMPKEMHEFWADRAKRNKRKPPR